MELHCFASENQTYTGTWLLALSLVFKGQENLLLKNLQVKTRVENVRFLSWRIFFVGKYGIQSTNEMAFKRIVTLRASFRFPAIRFDAPTLLSFSGFTHAHAKCPPVVKGIILSVIQGRIGHGRPEKSWHLGISFSRPRKSWRIKVVCGRLQQMSKRGKYKMVASS